MISQKILLWLLKFSLLLAGCQPRIRDVPVVTPRAPAETPTPPKEDGSVIILPEMIQPADKDKTAMTLQQMYASLPEYKGEYSSEDSESWVANLSVMRGVICLQGEKATLEIVPQLEKPEREQTSDSDKEFFRQLTLIAEHMRALDPVLSQRIGTFIRDFSQQTLFSDFPLTDLITEQNLASLILKPYQRDCRIALGAINHAIMVGGNRFERYIWNPLWRQLTPPEKVQWALTWMIDDLGLISETRYEGLSAPFLTFLSNLQEKSYQITEWVEYASTIDAIGGKYLYPYGELWLDATKIKMDEGGMISGWFIHTKSPPQIKLGSVLLSDEGAWREFIAVSFKGGKIKTMASYGEQLSIFLGGCELQTENFPWNIIFLDEAQNWFSLVATFDLGPCFTSLGILRENSNATPTNHTIKKDAQGISFPKGISISRSDINMPLGWSCGNSFCETSLMSLYPNMKIKELYLNDQSMTTTDGKVYTNGNFTITYDEAGKIIKIIGNSEK
jgi:hypothetical protein